MKPSILFIVIGAAGLLASCASHDDAPVNRDMAAYHEHVQGRHSTSSTSRATARIEPRRHLPPLGNQP